MREGFKRLSVDVDGKYLDSFRLACRENDTDVSKEIRKFIKDYVRKSADTKQLGLKV